MRTKILNLVAILLSFTAFLSCDKDGDESITFDTLPSAAKTTIETYFDKSQISVVLYDGALINKEYEVLFKDGTLIDFDKNGAWENIEALNIGVPMGVIPTKIADYITTNYSTEKVIEIEKDNGYEVVLDNKIELGFDSSGNHIAIDVD